MTNSTKAHGHAPTTLAAPPSRHGEKPTAKTVDVRPGRFSLDRATILASKAHFERQTSCLSNSELLSLLNDTVEPEQTAAFHAHIERCEACQRRLDRLACEGVADLPRRATIAAAEIEIAEDLIQSLQQEIPVSLMTDAASCDQSNGRATQQTSGSRDLDDGAETIPCVDGPLRVLNTIGEGGMAVVFGGYDEATKRRVAIKVLRQRYAEHAELRERFRREVAIQARLDHGGVAKIHDFGELQDDRPYVVMAYHRGQTLSQELQGAAPRDVPGLLEVFMQVCEITAYAHAQGIYHRDLKPSNILIEPSGRVVVLDWGLAADARDSGELSHFLLDSLPGSGHTICGTPGYMSPEQLRGNPVEPTTDVYSLGVVLAEILMGERFVVDEHSSLLPAEVVRMGSRIVDELLARDIEPGFVALVQRCLDPCPSKRPGDASVLVRELFHANKNRQRVQTPCKNTAFASFNDYREDVCASSPVLC